MCLYVSQVVSCLCAVGEGINIDESNELFSLAALEGRGNLAEQAEVPAPTQQEMEAIAASSDDEAASLHSSDDLDDSDDDERYIGRLRIHGHTRPYLRVSYNFKVNGDQPMQLSRCSEPKFGRWLHTHAVRVQSICLVVSIATHTQQPSLVSAVGLNSVSDAFSQQFSRRLGGNPYSQASSLNELILAVN